MKFFQRQRIDQIGITAVTLQKILIFLMLLSIFSFFNGGFISFILCLIGFIGAYRRSPGLLTAYVTISVSLILLALIVAVAGTLFVTSYDDTYTSGDYYYSNSNSNSNTNVGDINTYSTYTNKFASIVRTTIARVSIGSDSSMESGPENPTNSNEQSQSQSQAQSESLSQSQSQSQSQGPSESFSVSSDTPEYSYYSYSDDNVDGGIVFLFIIVILVCFFIVYIKIYSIVLAWRLRKMIVLSANTLPTTATTPTEPTQRTHEFVPTNTSCAVPQENEYPGLQQQEQQPQQPMFAPGYAPFPYPYPYPMMPMMPNMPNMPNMPMPNMQGGQQFPHAMFGQQPIFYTYAPMPQNATEEK